MVLSSGKKGNNWGMRRTKRGNRIGLLNFVHVQVKKKKKSTAINLLTHAKGLFVFMDQKYLKDSSEPGGMVLDRRENNFGSLLV